MTLPTRNRSGSALSCRRVAERVAVRHGGHVPYLVGPEHLVSRLRSQTHHSSPPPFSTQAASGQGRRPVIDGRGTDRWQHRSRTRTPGIPHGAETDYSHPLSSTSALFRASLTWESGKIKGFSTFATPPSWASRCQSLCQSGRSSSNLGTCCFGPPQEPVPGKRSRPPHAHAKPWAWHPCAAGVRCVGRTMAGSGAMPTALRGHGRTMPLPQQPLLIGCHAHGSAWACGPPPPAATAPSHRVPCPRLCVGMRTQPPFRNSPISSGAMPTALRGHGGTGALVSNRPLLRTTGLTPSPLQAPKPPRANREGCFCGGSLTEMRAEVELEEDVEIVRIAAGNAGGRVLAHPRRTSRTPGLWTTATMGCSTPHPQSTMAKYGTTLPSRRGS